jgi:hypothetical protein
VPSFVLKGASHELALYLSSKFVYGIALEVKSFKAHFQHTGRLMYGVREFPAVIAYLRAWILKVIPLFGYMLCLPTQP